MKPTHHPWRFFRAGGFDQVKLETGVDLINLHQLGYVHQWTDGRIGTEKKKPAAEQTVDLKTETQSSPTTPVTAPGE